MTAKGYVVGSGGFLGRVDPADPEGRCYFDVTVAGPHEEVELTLVEGEANKANGRFSVRFVASNRVATGNYVWDCSAGLQIETRAADKVGAHEKWAATVQPNGRVQLVIEHEDIRGQRMSSIALTFVEQG